MESRETEACKYAFPLSFLKILEVEVDPFKNISGDYLGLTMSGRPKIFHRGFQVCLLTNFLFYFFLFFVFVLFFFEFKFWDHKTFLGN